VPKVESSNLSEVNHDPHSNTLTVTFRDGHHYLLKDVPERLYKDLLASPSKGKFYGEKLRGKYPTIKVK
jgi:hypothetical protein